MTGALVMRRSRRTSPETRLREKLVQLRGLTNFFPSYLGALDPARKQRFADWMLAQPADMLEDLANLLAHPMMDRHGDEAILLVSMLRAVVRHRRRETKR